jgi:uncharacterized membrane protein YoaK (UPF0700 family)
MENKTTQELQNELKNQKNITGALIGVLITLFSVCIYGLFFLEKKTTFIALIAVAISCGAILPMQYNSIKKLKTELSIRSEK